MDERRHELKTRIERLRGYFGVFHQAALDLDPDWLEPYLDFVCAPNNAGRISTRLTQLIYVAIDAAPSHLYPRGIGTHAELAMQHGATPRQVMETLEIAASLTGATAESGFPVLLEELAAAGLAPTPNDEATADVAGAYKDWIGEVPDWVEGAAALAPDCVAAMVRLMAYPWAHGTLPAKERALIALACNASPAVLNREGMRLHIRESLRRGASPQELAEVLVLASGIGIHSIAIGGPILKEVLDKDNPAGN